MMCQESFLHPPKTHLLNLLALRVLKHGLYFSILNRLLKEKVPFVVTDKYCI